MMEIDHVPAPLTPADCDLRNFGWMPLEVGRLRDSAFVVLASGDAFRAAVLLWCASWHQVPAASLPNDDRVLANLAGYGRDLEGWKAVRLDAMHGFVQCSDGRFYHPVLAEKAIEADLQRKTQRKRTEAATAARRNNKRDDDRNDDRDVSPSVERNEVQQTGPDQTLPDKKSPSRLVASDLPASAPSRFEEFWKAFPRREGPNPRKPAESKFNALVKTGVDPRMMIDAAKKLASDEDKRGNLGTRFIPQALTWLNQQRWADHAAVAAMASIAGTPLPIEEAVKMYAKIRHWPRGCGPEPGLTGCRASPELLAKYGLMPDGSKMSLGDVANRLPDAGVAFGPKPTGGLPERPAANAPERIEQ